MIDKLTKENLQKLGFKENDVNKLYNTIDTYNLQGSEGKVFVSKIENKIYTGIDFYRKIYLNNGSLRFPNNCPDLVNEYFDLALVEFLEKQKTVLRLLYNEEDQFNKFKSNEIKSMQIKIEGHKEFLLKMKRHPFESKENDIQICESYINYLNNKLFLKEKPLHKKLTVDQIALKMVYEGITAVTREEHGNDLYNKFMYWFKPKNRTGNLNKIDSTDLVIENRMKKIETVLELLPEDKKAKAFGDISILKSYLSGY